MANQVPAVIRTFYMGDTLASKGGGEGMTAAFAEDAIIDFQGESNSSRLSFRQ